MSSSGRHSATAAPGQRRRRRGAALLLWTLLLWPVASHALGSRKTGPLPWTVRMEVHWGTKKNRDAYRDGFARQLLERLVQQGCFRSVVDKGEAELLLDVQLNDFITEQEYAVVTGLVPGQGEEHRMIAARASVDLDYWLSPDGRTEIEIVTGQSSGRSRARTRGARTPRRRAR